MTPKNIIVRMPNWLGDLVMATPILADLRAHWPEAAITAMCQSNVAPVLKHDPHITELFSYKRPSGWVPHQEHWEIIDALREGQYDLGILLTNSFSSAWWFRRGKVQRRVGFKGNWRNLLLTDAVPFPAEKETQHLVKTYKSLLLPLGISISKTDPAVYVTNEEKKSAQTLLKGFGIHSNKQTVIGINPGAAYGTAKCWLPDRFAALTRKLLEKDPKIFVIYFGDAAGVPVVNEICQDLPDRVINLAGKTNLRELIALINCCSIFLTNDSGPMHLAAAMKIPLVALFGSTSDIQTGPYKWGRVIHKHVECSPCYKRVCPIDFKCMKRIEVDEVYQALVDLIC